MDGQMDGRVADGRTGGGQTDWHTEPNGYIQLDFLLTSFCYICLAGKSLIWEGSRQARELKFVMCNILITPCLLRSARTQFEPKTITMRPRTAHGRGENSKINPNGLPFLCGRSA